MCFVQIFREIILHQKFVQHDFLVGVEIFFVNDYLQFCSQLFVSNQIKEVRLSLSGKKLFGINVFLLRFQKTNKLEETRRKKLEEKEELLAELHELSTSLNNHWCKLAPSTSVADSRHTDQSIRLSQKAALLNSFRQKYGNFNVSQFPLIFVRRSKTLARTES